MGRKGVVSGAEDYLAFSILGNQSSLWEWSVSGDRL